MRIPHHSRCRKLDGRVGDCDRGRDRRCSGWRRISSHKGPRSRSAPHLAASDVSAWQFPVPNWSHSNKEEGRVDDVLQIGGTVFVGGNFTSSADHSGNVARRTYLASESVSSGSLTSWSPSLNGRVYALAASPDNSLLYVGGSFTQVNGQPYQHLVAFDLATGQISPELPPTQISGTVKAITQVGSDLYIGGSFSKVGGESHQRLAKLSPDKSGRLAVNSAGTQAPTTTCATSAEIRRPVACSPPGGSTASTATRARCTLRRSRPAPAHRCPGPITPPIRYSTSPATAPGCTPPWLGRAAPQLAYDAGSGSQLWYYMTDGNVQAVTTVDGWPVFGMHGDYVAPRVNSKLSEYGKSARISRHKVFMLSPDGVLQQWAPALETDQGVLGVWSLDGSSGTLEVGGDFTKVDGAPQARFAIFPLTG